MSKSGAARDLVELSQGKRDLAVEFIRKIRSMPREELHELILANAGEELARFFLAYATDLMEREPERAVENASSLLLIGYLIRCFEERSADGAAKDSAGPHCAPADAVLH